MLRQNHQKPAKLSAWLSGPPLAASDRNERGQKPILPQPPSVKTGAAAKRQFLISQFDRANALPGVEFCVSICEPRLYNQKDSMRTLNVMKKLKLVGLFACGLVVGSIAGGWWSWHVFSRLVVSKEVDAAGMTAQVAEWLAELRLNDPKAAIQEMEKAMDIQVFTLAHWDETSPPDAKMRKARDRWLVPVKVYHESYPVGGDAAARINRFLATIPGRSPHSTCKSGVCRLDDQRLANLKSKTNSP